MAKKNEVDPLASAIAEIEKQNGEGSIFMLGDSPESETEHITTGILPLDLALSGGLPRGRVIEVFGPPMSGKTTLALTTIARAQERGEICGYVDAEHGSDPSYARTLGVDTDKLVYAAPDTAEEGFFAMEKLCGSGKLSVIMIDSVAALLPRSMHEGDYGDAYVGMHPKFMSQSMGKLMPFIYHGNTCMIFLNQLRESIGKQYGSPEYRPGGKAVPFYSSTGLDVRRIRSDKNSDDEIFSHRTRVKVIKHRTGIPYRTAEFDLELGVGVPRVNCILDAGLESGALIQKGAWFATSMGENIGQGRVKALDALSQMPDLMDEIEAQARGVE